MLRKLQLHRIHSERFQKSPVPFPGMPNYFMMLYAPMSTLQIFQMCMFFNLLNNTVLLPYKLSENITDKATRNTEIEKHGLNLKFKQVDTVINLRPVHCVARH